MKIDEIIEKHICEKCSDLGGECMGILMKMECERVKQFKQSIYNRLKEIMPNTVEASSINPGASMSYNKAIFHCIEAFRRELGVKE